MENTDIYLTSDYVKATPKMGDDDTMALEIKAEEESAMSIVGRLKKYLQVSDAAKEMRDGLWWDAGPRCELRKMLRDSSK